MASIRIGFVGVGRMGQMAHLRNYVTVEGCEVVALAEIRPKMRRLVAERYGVPNVYADHVEMLAAEELDGVVVSQPFTRHAVLLPDIYPKVARVFTEKPLAVSVAAGERLAAAAADSGCVHMVGYHKRCDPATIHAKEVIDRWKASGEMGAMKYVRILMPAGEWIAGGMIGLIQTDETVEDLQQEQDLTGMDAETRDEYVAFVNYYIHQVNLMRHLLGEPYKVTYAEKSGVLLAVESDSGVAGVIEMSPYRTTLDWEETALVAFEHGYVRLRMFAPLTRNRAGEVEILRDPGDGATPQRVIPTMPWVHAMRRQAINFVEVCKGQAAPPCDAAEAVEDLRTARDYILMRKGQ